jgi:TonB family protein
MKGKQICSYLKSVRREVAAANGIDLEIPECTFEGECPGTCPRCESEVRQLESELSRRKSLSQRVAVLGVAAGLALSGMSVASAQTVDTADSTQYEDEWNDFVVGNIELRADFPGGMDSLYRYLDANLKYPADREVKGVVLTEFVVDEKGKVSDVTILKGLDRETDEMVKQVLLAMPPWEPGKAEGKPRKNIFQLPITFKEREE